MVDKFRIARLERLHKRCLDASDKYARLCHVALRSDDSDAWCVLSQSEWEQFPTSLLDLPDESHLCDYLEVILAHWLLGAMTNRPSVFESARKQHPMLQKWHEPQLRGILNDYETFVLQNFGTHLCDWEESQRMHRIALSRWLTEVTMLELWRIGSSAPRSVWNRLHFEEPPSEWYGTFTDPNPFANIDEGISEFVELASELVPEVSHRSALPNHPGLEERDHIALGKQWIQFLYDSFHPARKRFGFVEGTKLEWNVFSASARAIEEILIGEDASSIGSVPAANSRENGTTDKFTVAEIPVPLAANDAEHGEDFDQYFFYLWDSALEKPLPFARVYDISISEAEWLRIHLQEKADEYFLVDMSKETSLNAYNLNVKEFLPGFRLVAEGENEVRRMSLREMLADENISDWLLMCDEWPSGEWTYHSPDWQGEDLYRWVDELHRWSDNAISELKHVRKYAKSLDRTEPFNDKQKSVDTPKDSTLILVTLQQAAEISYRSKKTLESWKQDRKLPEEYRKGKGRSPALWDWSLLRPVLEELVEMSLPERPQVSSSGANEE